MLALVDRIRSRMPGASIGSDIIVGFPGESDDDFEALASYLERSPLTHLHVFPYSDRPGTAATSMDGKVPGAVVRERARRIREIGQRLTAAFREAQIGATRRGLTLEDGSLVVTDNYLKVRIPSGHRRNEWVRVRVTAVGRAMRGDVVTGMTATAARAICAVPRRSTDRTPRGCRGRGSCGPRPGCGGRRGFARSDRLPRPTAVRTEYPARR